MTVRTDHFAFREFLLESIECGLENQFGDDVLLSSEMIEVHCFGWEGPTTVGAWCRLDGAHEIARAAQRLVAPILG